MDENKLDTIIKLLIEINDKISADSTAHNNLNTQKSSKPKKLTEKQRIHQLATEAIAADRIRRKKRAEKMFAKEQAVIDELKSALKKYK